MSTPSHDHILRKPEVLARVGVTDATLRRWEDAGQFPRRFKINPLSTGKTAAVGWLRSQVDAWIGDRLASA